MFAFLDPLREITFVSVLVRLTLAMICGGFIGIERTHKRRPVGFRTHILICIGSAITTLTSEYLAVYLHYFTDIARLGAGVVAGVGFIGAGTIIVTRRQRVRGLTTAAGFWVSAIVGLALGAGYYEGGVITTLLVLVVELVFSKVEYWIMSHDPEVSLYVEYLHSENLDALLNTFQKSKVKVRGLEVSQISGHNSSCAIIHFRRRGKEEFYELMNSIYGTEGILTVEEL